MRDIQREAETQAEGEAGSLWEAQCGLDSGTPGSRPEPKADAQPLSHPGIPPTDHVVLDLQTSLSLVHTRLTTTESNQY